MRIFEKTHISTATTTVVKSGQCVLRYITVNTTAAGTITVYDNTSAVAPVVAVIAASVLPQTFRYDAVMTTGITVVTAGASDITVVYEVV